MRLKLQYVIFMSTLTDYKILRPLSQSHLVCGQDPEGVDDLFGSVDVGGLARHEVEEAVELDVARCVGVHDGQDALEVDLTLAVLK